MGNPHRYCAVANRNRKNQKEEVGSLVLVKIEKIQLNTCQKLNAKWKGPFIVVELLRDGSTYVLRDVFTGTVVQRAVVKVKPYQGTEEWLLDPQEMHGA